MQFSMDDGVFGLLSCAVGKASAPKEYTFYLSGDLSQMSSQKVFLCNQGFDVSQSDVYPVLKEEDVPRALKLIYQNRVEGWWHYKERYVKLSICTAEEFDTALEIQCSRNKEE
jgi:hypothetical protein